MRVAGSWKGYGIAFFSAVLVCGGPPTGPGYLARIGPSPLRFRSEFQRNPAEVLPPLPDHDETPQPPPLEIPLTPLNESEGSDVIPDPFENAFSTPDANTPANPAAPQTGPMVPQMLLQYFVRGTNQTAVVTAPVEFTPPPPPPANRSSAVYISK
jgi:hypothetical protein